MPPKGSKKKAKDSEKEAVVGTGIDHYEVPKATIARVAKGSVPEGTKLAKEVPVALVRATTVFVSYLAAISQDLAAEKTQKTITAAHVLAAVNQLDWDDAQEVNKMLSKELKAYKAAKTKKPKASAAPATASTSQATPAASTSSPSRHSLNALLDGTETATPLPSTTAEPETSAAVQIQAEDGVTDAESYGEPDEDDVVDEELSDDDMEEEEERVEPEVEDKGLQDDVEMGDPEE